MMLDVQKKFKPGDVIKFSCRWPLFSHMSLDSRVGLEGVVSEIMLGSPMLVVSVHERSHSKDWFLYVVTNNAMGWIYVTNVLESVFIIHWAQHDI